MITSVKLAELAAKVGIKGWVIIGLVITLGITMWRADVISGKLADEIQAHADEKAAHKITRGSVDTLETELAKFIGAGEASRVAQLAAIEAQAEESAEMRAEADEIRSMISEIDPIDVCRTPDFVLGN